MAGALTAADDFDFNVDMVDPEGSEDIDVSESPSGIDVSSIADLSPVYDAAIERLRAQRRGLSGRERLGALLVGFGQPTRHGKWQEGVANASQVLFQQSLARRKEDEARRLQLERLQTQRDVAKIRSDASIKAAEIRAGAKGPTGAVLTALGHKPNADEIKRIGIVTNRRPNMTPEEVVKSLYEPWVERLVIAPQIAASATNAGDTTTAEEFLPPAGMTISDLRKQAEEALAAGAPREKVLERLRRYAVSTEGL